MMSERLKSKYLRKREEISSNSSKFFIAGLLFALFMLFLFYQFRAIILQPTFASDNSEIIQDSIEVSEHTQKQQLLYPQKDTYNSNSKIYSEQNSDKTKFQHDEKSANADKISSEVKPKSAGKPHDKTRTSFHHKNIKTSKLHEKINRRWKSK